MISDEPDMDIDEQNVMIDSGDKSGFIVRGESLVATQREINNTQSGMKQGSISLDQMRGSGSWLVFCKKICKDDQIPFDTIVAWA
jgi:hypothetical protein